MRWYAIISRIVPLSCIVSLQFFLISITSLESPPKTRREGNRTTAIPPMSTKGLPETQHATKDTAKPLPGHPSPEKVDESEKEREAQLQEVSTKLSESQDKLSPKTKTPLKSP